LAELQGVAAASATAPTHGELHGAVQMTMQGLSCHFDPEFGRVLAVISATAKVGWGEARGREFRRKFFICLFLTNIFF
jgi:hypothetical protein